MQSYKKMGNKVSKIVIDISGNEYYVITKDHAKYQGTNVEGVRNIFDKGTQREDFKIVVDNLLDIIDSING